MLPVERRHMANQADLRAAELALESRDHLFLVRFVAGEAHLDQFVDLEGFVDGREHSGRQTGFADLNYRFEIVSEAAQVAALISV